MKFLFKFYGHIYKITNFLIFVFSIENETFFILFHKFNSLNTNFDDNVLFI